MIDNSFFEILFVSKKQNSNQPGVSMRSKKSLLDSQNNLNFSSSKIQFMSINIDKDIIDVFLLLNNKKVLSQNPDVNNYYRIIAKDIGVQDKFKELTFVIVNEIQLTINIKFKNKFSTQSMSMKDRLKFFNQQKETKKAEPQYIPKKLKMPTFLHETKKEEPKRETPKKIEDDYFSKQEDQRKEPEKA